MTNDTERFHEIMLSYPETTVGEPFGPGGLVYKVAGKMFSIFSIEAVPPKLALKCDPVRALELRDEYPAIDEGYHLNKKHWNTLTLDGSLEDKLVIELIQHSFDCVVAKMSKKDRERLNLNMD